MNIFSKEPVNTGRQPEVDWLRGATAVILVIVHTGLYLGNNISRGLWIFCDVAGSEFAAPVFMALMGISMAYSRHQSPKDLLKRGIKLFAGGYLLNLFRSLLPLAVAGNIDQWTSVEAFLVVDILQFAGLSFMFFSLFRALKLASIVIFAVSIIMVIINQFIMLPAAAGWDNKLLTGMVNLFCPISEWSCFPFLTWFAFPAFGLVYGEMLTRCRDKKKLYAVLLPAGLLGVLYVYSQFYMLYPEYTRYYWGNNFYYMGLKNVLLTCLFVCFALAFWFFAGRILPDAGKRALVFLSKNLNVYYIFSWLVISALIHVQAICRWQFNTPAALGIMVLLILLCAGLARIWQAAGKAFAAKSVKKFLTLFDFGVKLHDEQRLRKRPTQQIQPGIKNFR